MSGNASRGKSFTRKKKAMLSNTDTMNHEACMRTASRFKVWFLNKQEKRNAADSTAGTMVEKSTEAWIL